MTTPSKIAVPNKLRRNFYELGERLYNCFVTYLPSHTVRLAWLRLFGATIGKDTSIMLRTRILGMTTLRIGEACSVGAATLLDARGGLTIDDCVVIASDVHIISGTHGVDDPTFPPILAPVVIGHHVWIASRATVLMGLTIGAGAVVGACSLVRGDVAPMEMVAGVPAKVRGIRDVELVYRPKFRPALY